ncbi:MAG: helix-turn-helix transcriptional regulator [Bacteroidia bacterium]|jgi:transcriptional regulator with XRE-family HTH domain
MHTGRKIKLVRIAKGLTQQDLADKIGKTRPLVSSIEQTGVVNVHTLRDICKALDIDLDEVDQIGSMNDPLFPYNGKKTKELEEQLRAEIKKLKSENDMLKDLAESQKDLIKFLKNQPAKPKTYKKK